MNILIAFGLVAAGLVISAFASFIFETLQDRAARRKKTDKLNNAIKEYMNSRQK